MKKRKVVFAELPQASKSRKWRLRNFRKRFQKRFGPRVASVKSLCRFYAYIELTLRVKKCAELALFCFFCVDRKQMV